MSVAADLNPEQSAAVETPGGPLLVLAGAGTGKTKVVTHRIAALIRRGVPPERILAVTFTNRAADEMQSRAAALLGRRLPAAPEISTFHSLCVRILRRQISRLGYPPKFSICDRGDQESVARSVLREIKGHDAALRSGDLLAMISRWKNEGVEPQEANAVARNDRELLGAAGYRRYQNKLRLAGALDFDDLLLFTSQILERDAQARAAEAGRFDHILIDEYQDTNGCQYRIVRRLAEEHRNLCVVGDDDQSIYSWRGAVVTHILQFRREWPGAVVVRLERNYRSTAPILGLANRLIAKNVKRHDKELKAQTRGGTAPVIASHADEHAEALEVVSEIAAALGARRARPGDFAVLMRTNDQTQPFESRLRTARIPYVVVGGTSFYDRTEVKDVLAYLKLLVRPHDEPALLRVINTPPRGIGETTVKRLISESVARKTPIFQVLEELAGGAELPAAGREALNRFRTLLTDYGRRLPHERLADVATDLLVEIGYQREVERRYSDPLERQARWAAVDEVVELLHRYQQEQRDATLAGFLADTALGGRDRASDRSASLERNAVALMTLHAAKGLEFPYVYLVGVEEGILPHANSSHTPSGVEEERRLCYVGLTRARQRLTVSWVESRMSRGKPRVCLPSRFVFEMQGLEIPPHVVQAVQRARAPSASETRPGVAAKRPAARPTKVGPRASRR